MKKLTIKLSIIPIFLNLVIGNICPDEQDSYLIKRRILALYDSNEEKIAQKTVIAENAEVILNHLGFILDYQDVNLPLPEDKLMERYCGIITWFQDSIMKQPEIYCSWLIKQIEHGKKIVILDQFGAFEDNLNKPTNETIIESVFEKFGVKYIGNETDNPLLIETVYKDEKMVEFERKLSMETSYYTQLKQIDPSLKVYLKLKRIDIPDSESCAIFSSKTGAMAIQNFTRYYNENNYNKQWRINPFLFFAENFQADGPQPVPDLTTYFGKRILFTHIDGDGFINGSLIDNTKLCSEIIINSILKKYIIPTSASIITGELLTGNDLPWIKGRKDLNAIAKSLYEIPYIEPASHGYTHPLDWKRKITAIIIPPYSDKFDSKNKSILDESRYESLNMNMGYISIPQDKMLHKEIIESIDYINNNFVADKTNKTKLFLWTGNCSPPDEALVLCAKHKIKNINGGDSVFDAEKNSYAYLSPVCKTVNGGIQVYTAACNENIYTNLWNGPYYGFRSVIETFKRTESPIRIKPANIYYHFYSGERFASVSALEEVYNFVISQDYFPIYTSKYIDIVYDWLITDIYRIEENGFLITNKGELRTIRFDNCKMFPDMQKSSGVIGFIRYQGSLYVSLDGSGEAKVFLTDTAPESIYLRESTCAANNIKIIDSIIHCEVSGFGPAKLIFSNLVKYNEYEIEFSKVLYKVKTDSQGNLTISLPEKPVVKIKMPLKISRVKQSI